MGLRCFLHLGRALAIVLLSAVPPAAWADITGRLAGTIRDQTGAVIPGVTVTVVNAGTQVTQTTISDNTGSYAFPSLPAGRYDIEARQPGFKDFREQGLVVDVNAALRADITLEVGQESQKVEVNAAAVQVETTSTQMGEVISTARMTSVPLNGRSYTDLLALQPGVAPASSGQYSGLAISGDLNPGNFSVSGQRESANGFMVNGANVQEGANMGTAVIPNLDSIAEFRILTNNFDAEYGNYSGGQVNAITKSGTNEYHGDVFEFLRNTDLDSRNFFSPDRGRFIQNQFGATAGGPILKDKLFFFGDYQGTRQILGQSTGDIPVPSLADRAGNLSDIAPQLTGQVNGNYWASQLAQKLGYNVTAGEPYYAPGCVSNAQCVFPNAVIPQAAISPIAQNLLKYIPQPNSGAYYSTSAFNQNLNDDKGGIRIDSNSRFGMISGYYFLDDFTLNSPYGSSTLPGFAVLTNGRSQLISFADTKTLNPTAVNEFHMNYTRLAYFQNQPAGGLGTSLSSLGFAVGPQSLGLVVNNPAAEGVPPVQFNSYSLGVAPYFQGQYNNTYQIFDNFSKVLGRHTIKFGGSAHYDQITDHDFGANNGTFMFAGNETGSDFADFLLGAPSTFQQGVQEPLHTRAKYYGLYAQDSWRVTSNLTLNFGLRWEVTSPWYEAQGQLETIVPGLQSKVFPGSPTGWVFPGDPGIPTTLAPTRYNNFAPRIGLAYSPSKSGGWLGRLLGGPGKTSIRAGFGMFYTAFEDATGFVEVGDAPFGFFWSSPTPPLFATPYVDRSTGNVEGQRFPVSFPPPNVSASNPDNSVNWAQYLPISGSPAFYYKNRVPYAEDYSFSLQRQFGTNSVLSVSYVGTQGHALLTSEESNPGNPALCLSVSQPSQVAPGSATCGPFSENGVFTTAAGQVINGTRRLGNNFGENQYFITIGNSNYNSLQVSFKHTAGPLDFLAGYTWSKSIDDGSGYEEGINVLNARLSRSLSSFDVPQNFVISYSYHLPFAHFFGNNRLAAGWILSGITRFASGFPVTLRETDDQSLLGAYPYIDTPNYTPGNLQIANPRSGQPYFNVSLFSPENLGQLGTASRRFFHGPGIDNFDMALLKDTRITESMQVQFRLEFFNVFNHAQFNNPTGNIDSSAFGYVISARDPRIGQVALKFVF